MSSWFQVSCLFGKPNALLYPLEESCDTWKNLAGRFGSDATLATAFKGSDTAPRGLVGSRDEICGSDFPVAASVKSPNRMRGTSKLFPAGVEKTAASAA